MLCPIEGEKHTHTYNVFRVVKHKGNNNGNDDVNIGHTNDSLGDN